MEIDISKRDLKKTLAVFMALLIAISGLWVGFGVESRAAYNQVGEFTLDEAKGNLLSGMEEGEVVKQFIWGDNVLCTLYDDGSLVLEGDGEIQAGADFISGPENIFESTDYDDTQSAEIVKRIWVKPGITSIGSGVFRYFYNLEYVVIDEGVTKIDTEVFGTSPFFKTLWLPSTIEQFDFDYETAYRGNEYDYPHEISLETIYYNGEIAQWNNVEKSLFGIEESIKNAKIICWDEIIYPDSVSDGNVTDGNVTDGNVTDGFITTGFCGDNASYTIYSDGRLVISGEGAIYDSYSFGYEDLIETIEIGEGITSIGNYAFSWMSNLSKVSIPNSVTSIGESAFYNCLNLTDLNIPDGVRYIGYGAFLASGIENVIIPQGVEVIEDSVFFCCENLSNVSIPDSVISIGDSAFYGCTSLSNLIIPDGVKNISSYAFGASGIESIVIPQGIEIINDSVFDSCENLNDITIPDSVTSIGEGAFYYCTSLTDLKIPNGVTYIGNSAFEYSGIENITIPQGVEHIGDYTFRGCDFESFTVPDNIKSIGTYAFASCPYLQSITIADSVESIGENAFSKCRSLTSIRIPDGIRSIEKSTFANCPSLAELTIPYSVTDIGELAFYNCGSLKRVYFLGTKLQWDSITINPNRNDCLLNAEIVFAEDEECTHSNTVEYAQQDATCIADGYTAGAYCPDCDEWIVEREVIEATNHKNKTEYDKQDATCTESGLTAGTYCPDCDTWIIEREVIEAINHKNKVEYDKQNATCTVNGYTAGVYCPDCEEWLSGHEVIEAKHSPVTYTQNATCGVNGYKRTSCSVCGESLDYEIIPAGEHEFSSWTVTKKSTCTVNGEESRSCSICGETETRTVTAPGHSWSAWKITEATLMSAGEKTRSCSACGEAERVVLPKLEGEVAEDKNSGVKVEYTDDSYNGKDMQVLVQEDFTGSQYLGMSYGNFVSWNIKTYVDGKEVQPDAPVLVTIPIPSNFNKEMIVVYHVDSVTGNLEKIEPVIIEGDTIKFLASSFSIYMVVDESSVIEEEPSKDCDCNCHKSGFMSFIWKILNFFYKLFKMKPTCVCGVAHY